MFFIAVRADSLSYTVSIALAGGSYLAHASYAYTSVCVGGGGSVSLASSKQNVRFDFGAISVLESDNP